MRIGKHHTLAKERLFYEDKETKLRHQPDFDSFIFSTAALTGTAIPFICQGTPLSMPEDLDAYRAYSHETPENHFTRLVLLNASKNDSSGRVRDAISAYHVALVIAAKLTGHSMDDDMLFPAQHIFDGGFKAAGISQASFEEYVAKLNAFHAFSAKAHYIFDEGEPSPPESSSPPGFAIRNIFSLIGNDSNDDFDTLVERSSGDIVIKDDGTTHFVFGRHSLVIDRHFVETECLSNDTRGEFGGRAGRFNFRCQRLRLKDSRELLTIRRLVTSSELPFPCLP